MANATVTAAAQAGQAMLNSGSAAKTMAAGSSVHAPITGNLTGNLTGGGVPLSAMYNATESASQYVPGQFGWSGYFEALGAVFVILALLMAGFWLLRRYGPKGALGRLKRSDLSIEGQLPLGPKKHLVVVQFLNKRLLLGVTDSNINLLTELDDKNDQESQGFSEELERVQKNGADAS